MTTTTTEKKEVEPAKTGDPTVEKKREIISVQVSAEEKRLITRMAIKDCGISVSEFVRTKVFAEPAKQPTNEKGELSETPLTDEEKEMYEEKMTELNAENRKLKDEIVKIKVLNADPGKAKEAEPAVSANTLILELSEGFKNGLDALKKFRDEKALNLPEDEKAAFASNEKYLKTIFLRGLKRSFNNGILGENTGLKTEDIKTMAAAEEIDYDDEI